MNALYCLLFIMKWKTKDVQCAIEPFNACRPIIGTLANSAEPDQAPHNTFDQCLHCLFNGT